MDVDGVLIKIKGFSNHQYVKEWMHHSNRNLRMDPGTTISCEQPRVNRQE